MKKAIIIFLMMFSSSLFAQELKLTLGVGLPVGDNDTMNGNNTSNRYDAKKGDVIGSFIITMPLEVVDLSLWHHSLLNSNIDDGLSGLSLTKTWTINY